MTDALTGREKRRRNRLFRREGGLTAFLREEFQAEMGFEADLEAPRRLSERLLYLRLFNRDPLMPVLASYTAQREYLRAKKQERSLARVYAEGKTFRALIKKPMPSKVLLRPTHLPDECFAPSPRNRREALRQARAWYEQDAYLRFGAWEYRGAPRGLVAESPHGEGERLRVLVLGGEARLVARRPFDAAAFSETGHPLCGAEAAFRPEGLERACMLARALGEEFPFLRVDVALSGGRVVFEGLRFFEEWALLSRLPPALDEELGSFLPIPVGLNTNETIKQTGRERNWQA